MIASNVGGIPALIVDRKTGFLCDPQEGESIRVAIRTCIQNPSLAETVAQAAKKDARVRFLPERIAATHLEIYRDVLQTNS